MASKQDTADKATALEASPVRILPELHPLVVSIDQPTPWPGNPRRSDDDKLRESLRDHGQYAALLVHAGTGQVIKGNNTLRIMRELGATHVAAQTVDVDEDRALRILAIDNASTDEADYDRRELAKLLSELPDLTGTGWETDQLDDLLAELEHDADEGELPEAGEPVYTPPAQAADDPPRADSQPQPDHHHEPDETGAADTPGRIDQSLSELVLVLPEADRKEAVRIVADLREWLGADLKTGEVVLRALRTAVAVADARHHPDTKIDVGALVTAATYSPELP